MRLRNPSLGTKLSIALLVFLLVLGAATSAIIIYGFNRTQDNANERSRQALEEEGKLALQAFAGGIADTGALQLEYAAEVGQRASRYLQDFQAQGAITPPDVSRFVQTEDGVWYNPDPDRASEVIVVNHAPALAGAVLDDITYSAPLDALFGGLAEGFPGELSGDAFRPFAIVYIGVNGSVGRYYPPIGITENTPAELDLSDFYDRFGPVANPERTSVWVPPYEDLQGRGLVITAQTPVYDNSDTFRGIFEVDISIEKLVEQVNELKPTEHGFTFYVDSEGEIMHTDAYDLLTQEAGHNQELAGILDSMGTRPPGSPIVTENVRLNGEPYFIAHTPLSPIGGSIAVAAPVDELTAQAATITAGINREGDRTFWIMLASMGGLFVAGLIGATWLNRRVLVAPIQRLASATRAVAAGDLDTKVALDRSDELGELAGSFNVMVEQLRESERSLERQVEERTRELDGLLRADTELFRSLDLDEVLQALVDVAVDVLGVHKSLVSIWDPEQGKAVVRAVRNIQPDSLAVLQGWLANVGHSGPASDYPPMFYDADVTQVLPPELLEVTEREGVRATTDIPIRSPQGTVLGGFGVMYTEPHTFSEAEQRVLIALAERAAVAIGNAELYARAQQAASLEERQRLARELHDSVSQALYGIALGARTAREQLDREPAKAVEPVEYVLSLAQAGLAEMRALIFELRPESLENEGIVAALRKQVEATVARFGVPIELDLCDEPTIPIEQKETLYRVAQEALHNTVKHAKARHGWVSLRTQNGSLTLEVRDDGMGFDPDADYAGHLGLRSMRERVARQGGEIRIESKPGGGSRVVVALPV